MNLLIIKNGDCCTEIDKIICDIDNTIRTTIIRSCDSIDINIAYNYDGIIILGGYQSLVDVTIDPTHYEHQYLIKLITYVKQWIHDNLYVLGICLGAQIIGSSLGYRIKHLINPVTSYGNNIIVYHGKHNKLIDDEFCDKLRYVLSLHNDYIDSDIDIDSERTSDIDTDVDIDIDNENIDIIAGLDVVSSSDKKKVIPYIINFRNTYGFQFHPEITLNVLESFCVKFKYNPCLIDFAKDNQSMISDASHYILAKWINFIKDNNK